MKFAARINSFKSKGKTTLDIIREISEIEKVTHVDLNYPEHFENTDFEELKNLLEEKKIKVNGLALRFRDEYKNGELGNTDKKIAEQAKQLCLEAIDTAEKLGADLVTIWLGYDGFDYSFQIPYEKTWSQLVKAFKEIASYNKKIKISIEYKPFQPRAFSMISSIGTTLLMVRETEEENIGVTLDYCHMLMKGENPAYGLSLAAERKKLYGVHMNDGHGLNDDGLITGSVTFIKTLEFIYYLKKYSYDGVIYFDTFPIRENGIDEVRKNIEIYEKLEHLVEKIGIEKIGNIVSGNDAVKAQNILLECLG